MQAHGLGTPNPDGSYASAHSSDPGHHDCLDDCRGMCFSLGSLDGTQPRAARLRRGQRNRTPLGWGSVVALSGAIAASGCGATSRPNRRSAALRCCGMRCRSLRGLTAGISRPSAYLPRTDNSGGRSADHAVACSSEAPVVSAALRADAVESALCAYLSWIALVGIGLNAIWQIGWADSAAALIIVPLIVREGFQSMHRRPCACC